MILTGSYYNDKACLQFTLTPSPGPTSKHLLFILYYRTPGRRLHNSNEQPKDPPPQIPSARFVWTAISKSRVARERAFAAKKRPALFINNTAADGSRTAKPSAVFCLGGREVAQKQKLHSLPMPKWVGSHLYSKKRKKIAVSTESNLCRADATWTI